MEQYKEKNQTDDAESSKQTLREKINKLQQERERGAGKGFSRQKIREFDAKIERLMKELGV